MFGGRDEDEGGHPIVGLLGILVAPLAATLIQMAISRFAGVFGGRAWGTHQRQSSGASEVPCVRSKRGANGYR